MSIYSAVGNIPEELMRNILRTCGVKLVESENDAVYRNDSYVSVASPYGGVKTIEFDHYVDVYDVFKGIYREERSESGSEYGSGHHRASAGGKTYRRIRSG